MLKADPPRAENPKSLPAGRQAKQIQMTEMIN